MRATLDLVSHLVTEGCEPECIKTRATGILRENADGYTLRYTEKTEGGTLTCALSFSEAGVVRIEQSGAILSDTRYAVGETHKSTYRIPPLSLPRSVTAREVRVERTDFGFEIFVKYDAEIAGARQSAEFTARIEREGL